MSFAFHENTIDRVVLEVWFIHSHHNHSPYSFVPAESPTTFTCRPHRHSSQASVHPNCSSWPEESSLQQGQMLFLPMRKVVGMVTIFSNTIHHHRYLFLGWGYYMQTGYHQQTNCYTPIGRFLRRLVHLLEFWCKSNMLPLDLPLFRPFSVRRDWGRKDIYYSVDCLQTDKCPNRSLISSNRSTQF